MPAEPTAPTAPRRPLLRRRFAHALMVALLAFAFFRGALRPAWIDGESMAPTLHSRRPRFINLLAYRRSDPQPGDVVAIRLAGMRYLLVKRVLAVPGQRIAFRDGTAWVDDQPLDEPYVVYRRPWNMHELRLGDGEYFVVGDHRGMSMRRHTLGVVARARIVGKIWP